MSNNGDGGYVDPDNPTVTIVEPSAAIEPGEVTGTIVETQVQSMKEVSDGHWEETDDPSEADAQYYQITLEVDETDGFQMSESKSLNRGRITKNTGLGALLQRFGVNLDDIGAEFGLDDIFYEGRGVRWTAVEDEEGEFLEIEEGTLEPVDVDDTPEPSGAEDVDHEAQVYTVVGNHDAPQKQDLLKELAQQDGNLVSVFNEMLETGDLSVDDDGVVSIA